MASTLGFSAQEVSSAFSSNRSLARIREKCFHFGLSKNCLPSADTEAEGARLAGLLDGKRRLLMGNHGVMVTAGSIGEAFDDIWTLERACQILVTAWSTGQPLRVLSDEVAEKTARSWEGIADFSRQHFEEMKQLMIDADPSVLD